MADETPEERLARFRELAQRVTDALELASQLAVSSDPSVRAMGQQQLPMWEHYVEQWRQALERLEGQIAEGTAD